LREGLTFAHNCLLGAGLRDKIKLGASGRIASAFDMARVLALGADWCNAARGFMFALGCVQSLSCHNDKCPTGVATQDPLRQLALDVEDKSKRVHNFHDRTLMALAEIVEATGLSHPREFHRDHFYRRVSPLEVKSFADVYPELSHGSLLNGSAPDEYKNKWARSRADRFMA
jgi:glutamate synthase domain-containing protein 2